MAVHHTGRLGLSSVPRDRSRFEYQGQLSLTLGRLGHAVMGARVGLLGETVSTPTLDLAFAALTVRPGDALEIALDWRGRSDFAMDPEGVWAGLEASQAVSGSLGLALGPRLRLSALGLWSRIAGDGPLERFGGGPGLTLLEVLGPGSRLEFGYLELFGAPASRLLQASGGLAPSGHLSLRFGGLWQSTDFGGGRWNEFGVQVAGGWTAAAWLSAELRVDGRFGSQRSSLVASVVLSGRLDGAGLR
ncbi:MAG: hypothetical protein D6729_03775 [Deltaproteobacteria bacterium]|nr:MAG: hypothetical protein D6729_03775 [Deltaproteobacteria bacterium]